MSAFAGTRIIDFSSGIAGPMATMLLADLGAEVIKVEPPGGDRLKDHPGYLCWNRNKQVLTLDVHRFEGLRDARSLLATADAAVFDWHPGELERSGLDTVSLREANPALLHAWFPPYSPTGRWSQLPADDGLLSGLTGAASLQYSYEDRPTRLIAPQVTYGQAMLGAGALAAGLYRRRRSGTGESVVVSGIDGASAVLSGGLIRSAGMVRMGGRGSRGGIPNYRLYQCQDGGWFFLGALTPQFFLTALDAAGMLDLLALEGVEGDFANLLRPGINQQVIAALDERFLEKPLAEWLRILHEAGVPRAPVGSADEWFASETIAANRMRLTFDHPRLGPVHMPGLPVRLDSTPGSVRNLPELAALDALPPHEPAVRPPAVTASEGEPGNGPLAGIRVLDLGAFIAGTFAPAILANWGADVIKVEPPEGDPFRTYGLSFVGYNRGKRGLAIDLKDPAGRELLLDLVRVSDVILDNYRVGVRDRLGIDYQALRAVNPRIISCSVTAYGPEGPLASDPGFDPLVQARSGLMAAQGGDDEPVFYQIPVNDTASAMMAAFGVAAALLARETTGEGQEVLTCLANQSILTLSGELTWYEGRPPRPKGGRDLLGTGALNRYYQCSDGWIGIAGAAPEHFPAVCVALGHPEWAGGMVAENALNEPAEGPLAARIAGVLAGTTRAEALDRLLTRGVPAAPAFDVLEALDDPWLEASDALEDFDHPQLGPVRAVRHLGRFGHGGGYSRRSPLIGEHSREVLADCGIAAARIEQLIAAGVVRQP